MKSTDLVRAILDLIDNLDNGNEQSKDDFVEPDSEAARIRQISDFLNKDSQTGYDNAPCEIVSDVECVTDHAGGGVNAPRHTDDIRVKDPRGYE